MLRYELGLSCHRAMARQLTPRRIGVMSKQGFNIIRTHGLTKQFGKETVVNSLDLEVPEGVVYGFLGPNGSGKSTTMKMLLGLLQPTAGESFLFGRKMDKSNRADLLRRIGSMIEAPPGYGHLTGWENMRIIQNMLKLDTRQIEWALEIVRLSSNRNKLVKNYSLGMKQRLGIAMALARNPELLILDEPVNGLDPAGIEEIRNLLKSLPEQGITVMVSSHLLDEVDKTATMLGIINQGQMIFQGTREKLLGQSIPEFIIETNVESAQKLLSVRGAHLISANTVSIPNVSHAGSAKLISQVSAAGLPVFEARRAEQSLEQVFMDITSGGSLK